MQRVFLDWQRPGVDSAAEYLAVRYGARHALDLSGAIVVVPSARGGRRLRERLVDWSASNDCLLTPPEIVTVGRLPELLYRPQKPFANALTQQLAWVEALRAIDPARLLELVPQPPAADDTAAWLALGELLARLHRELAAEVLDFTSVADVGGGLDSFAERARWELLADVQRRYLGTLDALDLWDLQTARLVAIRNAECHCPRDLMLLGAVDLNGAQRHMLDQVRERTTALIVAPEALAERFDAYGRLNASTWCAAKIALNDDQIVIAEGPADQATAVAQALTALDGRYASDEIVIGVPDEALIPFLQQRLAECNVPSRFGPGQPIERTPPVRLLAAVAEYLATHRFSALAALARMPEISDAVDAVARRAPVAPAGDELSDDLATRSAHVHDAPPRAAALSDAPSPPSSLHEALPQAAAAHEFSAASMERHGSDWLSALDRFASDRLPELIEPADLAKSAAPPGVRAAVETIEQFVSELHGRKPLCEWAEPILTLVAKIYGSRPLAMHADADRAVMEAASQLQTAAEQLTAMPIALCPTVSAAEALPLFLSLVRGGRVAAPNTPGSVELLGWLDLPLDDAPAAIVTSMNEGDVPSSLNADLFLPNQLRRHLGLEDNDRRYARDAYAIALLAASRERVTLIAGRRDSDGNPLFPSRLLMACEPLRLVERVVRFLQASSGSPGDRPLGALRAGGGPVYAVPRPTPLPAPVEAMDVTEFRDYLACPYRYYLRKRLGLKAVRDAAEELDGAQFGSLAHDVLRDFGAGEFRDLADEDEIGEVFDRLLREHATRRLGRKPRAAVRVQLEQLKRRLAGLARWQAVHRAAGWQIERVEAAPRGAELSVDGAPMRLRGRIDRIDRHPDGRRMLIDYKTGDKAQSPETVHRQKGEWIDLQLPLYRRLAASLGLAPAVDFAALSLGYLALPKDTSAVDWMPAPWTEDDLAAAEDAAARVVRAVRAEVFWPPAEPPPRGFDEFAGICMDDLLLVRSAGDHDADHGAEGEGEDA